MTFEEFESPILAKEQDERLVTFENDFETLNEPSLYIIRQLKIICCVNIVELNDCGQSVGKAVKIIEIRLCKMLIDASFGICGVYLFSSILLCPYGYYKHYSCMSDVSFVYKVFL